MMKKFLLSTVAVFGLTAVASAADLPRRTLAPSPVVAVPLFSWTGFYIGANAGYGFGTNDNNEGIFLPQGTFAATGPFAATSGTLFYGDNENEGFVGGGQIGFNYQFTPGSGFVVGIEADLQYADFGGNDNGTALFVTATGPGAPAGFVAVGRSSQLDYFGTVRARLGYAFDRVLVYGTGGFAYGGDDGDGGYAVGGGVEFALPTNFNLFGTGAVTFKVEGLYVNLDRGNDSTVGFVGATPILLGNSRDDEYEFGLVRAGINVKF